MRVIRSFNRTKYPPLKNRADDTSKLLLRESSASLRICSIRYNYLRSSKQDLTGINKATLYTSTVYLKYTAVFSVDEH